MRDGDTDEESQKKAIIETAARLIKSDIKTEIPSVIDQYPGTDMLNLDSALRYLQDTLCFMLDFLFVGKDKSQKVAGVGQAIIQAVRPRAVLAPVQIGLALQTHHLYRSRFIVDNLHKMGFSSSYDEVLRFEKNAADTAATDILGENIDSGDVAMLFASDNVDHNILTIDGKGSFHGMGIIAALAPGRKTRQIIPRQSASELKYVEKTRIDVVDYRFANHTCHKVVFKKIPETTKCNQSVDILWELSSSFKQETPNWMGMMHIIHQGYEHPGQSSILYLPMIDLYSGDKSCILSTLEFIHKQTVKHCITPIITFDQPLYWKASEIILDAPQNSPLKEIILLLGSFHTLMNLLGAIGSLMNGTGLKEILHAVYGENPVEHMMTGKSVQRAVRGHLLMDKSLSHMIVSDLVDESSEFTSLVDQCEDMYLSLLSGQTSLESVLSSNLMEKKSSWNWTNTRQNFVTGQRQVICGLIIRRCCQLQEH